MCKELRASSYLAGSGLEDTVIWFLDRPLQLWHNNWYYRIIMWQDRAIRRNVLANTRPSFQPRVSFLAIGFSGTREFSFFFAHLNSFQLKLRIAEHFLQLSQKKKNSSLIPSETAPSLESTEGLGTQSSAAVQRSAEAHSARKFPRWRGSRQMVALCVQLLDV